MGGLPAGTEEAGATAVGVKVIRFRATVDVLVVEMACVKVGEAGRELGADTGTVEVPFKAGNGVIWEDEDAGKVKTP